MIKKWCFDISVLGASCCNVVKHNGSCNAEEGFNNCDL